MPQKTIETPADLIIVAWGQYLHWAQLQFEQFLAIEEDVEPARLWGIASHWLAAEFVVLEGWRELGARDARIEALLALYPENCETLRRCRNAVYHFQKSILDQRIVDFITGEKEELFWASALHTEFQRFLVAYPYRFRGTFKEQGELADEIAGCIGWFPTSIPLAEKLRILRKCAELDALMGTSESEEAEMNRSLIAKTVANLKKIDDDCFVAVLSRWRLEGGNAA